VNVPGVQQLLKSNPKPPLLQDTGPVSDVPGLKLLQLNPANMLELHITVPFKFSPNGSQWPGVVVLPTICLPTHSPKPERLHAIEASQATLSKQDTALQSSSFVFFAADPEAAELEAFKKTITATTTIIATTTMSKYSRAVWPTRFFETLIISDFCLV